MRMIDKDALLSDIERTIEESGCVNHEGDIMDCVRYASEVDAVPVVRGEWVGVAHGRGGHECSKCRDYAPSFQNGAEYLSNYCTNCGAKMESV